MLLLFSTAVAAGTVVEIEKNNEITTAITDGRKVRINTLPMEYVILHSGNNSIKVINKEKRLVTLVDSAEISAAGNSVKVRTSLSPQGEGQVVAGYRTQVFSYTANGRQCGALSVNRRAALPSVRLRIGI